MFPRAEFSRQPAAAAADGLASRVAPAPCTAITVASAANAVTASTARLLLIDPPLVIDSSPAADAREPTTNRIAMRPQPGNRLLQAPGACGAEEPARFGAHEAHALVHQLERRLAGPPRLLGADGEQSQQLALVGAERLEALPDRHQELDDRLADGLLQVAVARAVEALLERLDRLAGRDAHDL